MSFTLDLTADQAPLVTSLSLLNDTGVSPTDRITLDPRLTGTIANDGNLAGLTVEFDHDEDDVYDGTATTDSIGAFVYVPEGLTPGAVTLRARAREVSYGGSQTQYGDWVLAELHN